MVTLVLRAPEKESYLQHMQQDIKLIKQANQNLSSNFSASSIVLDSIISSFVTNIQLQISQWKNKETVVIVGQGPSAKNFKAPDDLPIIAVNSAIQNLNRWDWFFSLNLNSENINDFFKSLENQDRKSVLAVPDLIVQTNQEAYPQAYIMTRVPGKQHLAPSTDPPSVDWQLWKSQAKLGLTEMPGGISAGNCAYGALNLAWHIGFKQAVLVGVDDYSVSDSSDSDHKTNPTFLSTLFQSATSQINIVNCGNLSGFPSIDFDQWYASLNA